MRRRPHRIARVLGVCAAGICAVAYLATIAAAMSYDRARVSIDQDTVAKAGPHLDAAIAADPSLALYHRQRGIVAYLDGDSSGAVRHLRRASELNPSDDLAFRALGLAYEGVGNPDLAGGALTRAVELQRSDVTNVLLLARWHALAGRADMASELLVEVVMSAPAIVAAPAWAELVGPTVETRDLLEEAAERWAAVPAEEPLPTDQALWLAVLADRQDLLGRVLTQAGTNVPMAESTVALLRCEPADRLLAAVEPGARQAQEYWSLRLWADASAGRSTDRTLRILAIMRGDFDTFSGATGTLNPLNENGATSADVWGYRRYPIQWPETPIELPSPVVGLRYWLTEPRAAVREAGLQDRLPGCD